MFSLYIFDQFLKNFGKFLWQVLYSNKTLNDCFLGVFHIPFPFTYTPSFGIIQVYAPTSNAEEAEVELFYEDL